MTDDSAETGAPDSGEPARQDMDGDGYVEGDCAETDPAVSPGASELCNGVDDNCDGAIDADAEDARTWFADLDGDGYGDEANTRLGCWAVVGYTLLGGDCDDSASAINPEAVDRCDGVDDNCSGDESDAEDAVVAYVDGDGDGFGFLPQTTCDATRLVGTAGDCDDVHADAFPRADEWCDGRDNNCDGEVDEEARDALTFYADADGDSFGDAGAPSFSCAALPGTVADETDCDDTNAGIGGPIAWFADDDGDGYGATCALACSATVGSVELGGDCDDTDPAVWPGAPEECDTTVDLNCDGLTGTADLDGDGLRACEDCDDGDAAVSSPSAWYADRDGDGYGDAGQAVSACTAPTGFGADATDCNDASSVSWPGATEIWYDDEDEDCAGGDDWDQDLDGFLANEDDCVDTNATVNPDGVEVCANHLDDDCDGTDNGCAPTGSQSLGDADVVLESTERAAGLGYAWSAVPDYFGVGESLVAVSKEGVDSGAGAVLLAPLKDLLGDGAGVTWTATWEGEAAGDSAGASISPTGDFDGDGVSDFLVGAVTRGSGAVYLIPADATGTQSLSAATARLDGPTGSGYFGLDVAVVPDLDGDGADEFLVGDWTADLGPLDQDRGCGYFFAGSVPSTIGGKAGQLCGDGDDQLWGVDVQAADVDGDGAPDMILTSYVAEGYERASGKVAFLALPFSGSLETDAADFFIEGVSSLDPIEFAGGVGDINGDGYEDVYTGHDATSTVAADAGSIHAYFGPLSDTISTDDAAFVIYGTREDEGVGLAASAGDVNGDGSPDLMVEASASNMADLSGRLGVYYGPMGSTINVDDADLLLEGEMLADGAGWCHEAPGDLNADGFDDLLIGAMQWGSNGEGRAYVWLGTGG